MVRQATRHTLRGALAVLVVLIPLLLPVKAAVAAAGPSGITVSGPGIVEAVTVRANERPEQFAALLAQVNWLANRPGQARSPDASKLGPRYVVTVYAGDKATHRYELYPNAAGGPRAYRPVSQPDKHRTTAAWFYGRLSMPDSLRAVGVPLAGTVPSVSTGGIGGGEFGGPVADEPFDPNADLSSLLAEWRRFILLNAAVVVVIALGLAGIALLVRHRTERLYRRRGVIR
jgi:hypothetical protein